MARKVALTRLAALVRAKRGKRGLREAAEEIGKISASTLLRIEKGKMPDLDTFIRLSDWLEIKPNDLIDADGPGASIEKIRPLPVSEDMTTPEIVEAHFRADKELDPSTAEALSEMVRAAYKAILDGRLGSTEREKRRGLVD